MNRLSERRWPAAVSVFSSLFLASLPLVDICGAAPRSSGGSVPGGTDTHTNPPLFFRATSGTTWVTVGMTGCNATDTTDSNHGPSEVWCFDGAGGDSAWPAIGSQGSGQWSHWSRFAPPIPPLSKWHVTTRNVGAGGGTYAAWCGCDSLGTNPACEDVAFWAYKEGYGDDWNYPLELDMSGQDATAGGSIELDLMYDCECNYDYMLLEYRNSTMGLWQVIQVLGSPTLFNGVSGNTDVSRVCGNDYFDSSDVFGSFAYYGNATWLQDVTFPMPAQSGGMRLRWRGTSDGAWSDADGRGDTDGIGRIDNVTVTFAASGSVVHDDFESGDFGGVTATIGSATWVPQGLQGNTYDGWHLEFDPKYKNKGNTCTFSDDWMWAAKPATGPIPASANGFDFFLVSPVISVSGWTAGVVEFSEFICTPDGRNDFAQHLVRRYDSVENAWSPWASPSGFFILDFGCEFWAMNVREPLTDFLGPTTDSLQIAWELVDIDQPGDFAWGFHTAVTYLVDNVSIGRFDASSTVFTSRSIDLFGDTFSRVDPAHTPFLANAEEGDWSGNGGARAFADANSLSVAIDDPDGITASNVALHYRVGTGTPPTFGAWANKPMVFSDPSPSSTTDEGKYRGTVGNTTTEDFSATEGSPDRIWDPGTTVEYYVEVLDDLTNVVTFPASAAHQPPIAFRFQVLPFDRVATTGVNLLLVDDYERNALDFEGSDGFDPSGGRGFGAFAGPAFDQPEDLVERALASIYGGSEDFAGGAYGSPKWDIYNVQGAGSSVQREPRILSNSAQGLGGVCDDLGLPQYDAVIWLQGTFGGFSFADTTRIELKTFLDNGGHLFATGDEIAFFLGSAGENADSVVQFLGPYLGTAFTSLNDDVVLDRVLNVEGLGGTSLEGLTMGLYGDCPFVRNFDKLTPGPDSPNEHYSTILATYELADPASNGRAAIIKNLRVQSNGISVLCGFGIEALVSTNARACLLSKTLVGDFGVAAPYPGCFNSGVDAPVIARGRFGFYLAQPNPNPFHGVTSIRFGLPSRGHATLEVFNVLGQRIRTIVSETLDANVYVREWDGRSDRGERASAGIYFYKLTSGDFSETRKAVLLK